MGNNSPRGLRGVRLDPKSTERTRAKIQTSQIVNRLNSYVNGQLKMEPGQVTAALGLLDRTLPRLSATELSGEVARPTVIRAPETVADSRTWLDKHGPERLEPDKPEGKPN